MGLGKNQNLKKKSQVVHLTAECNDDENIIT